MADYTSTVELKANTSKLESSMKKVSGRIDTMNAKLRGASGQFKKTTSTGTKSLQKLDKKVAGTTKLIHGMTAAFSAVAVGMFVTKSLKEFARFEDGIKQIGTLGVKELGKVEKAVFGIAKQFGTDANEAAKGYYDIISAGAKNAVAAQTQLTAAAKLAKAGNTDLGKSVDILTTAINVFGDNGETANSIIDKVFTTVKLGKTTVEELGQSFGLVAATADAAGVSLAEVGSSLAVMTAGGLSTSTAVTGLKAALSNVIKVTPKAEKAAKSMGIEFTQAALASKGFVAFFDDIRKKTGGSVVKLGELFDSVEAINAVATMTSEQGIKKLADAMESMKNSAGTVEKAWKGVGDSLSVLFARVSNTMTEASHSITTLIAGPIKLLLKSILDNGEGWKVFKKLIVGATTAATAFFVVFAVSKFKAIAMGVMALTKAMLLNPLFLVGGIAGYAVVQLFEKFGGFTDGFTVAINRMEVVWLNWMAGFKKNDMFQAFTKGVENIEKFFEDTVGAAFNYLSKLDWAGAWHGAGHFAEAAWDITKGAYEFLEKPLKSAYNYISSINWSGVWGTLGTETASLYVVMKDAYSFIAGPVEKVYNYISNINWSDMWGGLWMGIQDVKDWFYDMWDYLVGHSVVPDMVNAIGGWFDKMVGFITDPAKLAYDGITGWFTKMYNKVTGSTKDTVTEVNSLYKDIHGYDVDESAFDSAKINKLKESFNGLSGTMKTVAVSLTAIFGVAAVALIKKFSKSANAMFDTFRSSTSTITGKQGLVNKMLWGTEGGSRKAMGDIKKLRKEITRLQGGQAVQKDGVKAKGIRGLGANRAATLDAKVLSSQIGNAEAKIAKLGEGLKGRGIFSRMVFGAGEKTGAMAKAAGMAGQVGGAVKGVAGAAGTGAGMGASAVAEAGAQMAKITKAAGTVLRFLGKIALPLTAIIAVFDAWSGWTKAVDTDGDGIVSTFERYKGAAGSVLSGLTFGLISVENVSNWMDKMFSGDIGQTLTALFQISPLGLIDGFISKALIWFGDWLGFDTSSISEYQENGGISAMLGNYVKTAWTAVTDTVAGWFNWVMTDEDGSRSVVGVVVDFYAKIWKKITSTITGWFTIGDAVAADGKTDTVGEMIGVGLTNAWNNISGMVKGWFDFTLPDFGNLSGLISDAIKSVIKLIEDGVTNLLTFSSKERTEKGTTKARGLANGGAVFGAGNGTSDSIPAMLSNGEFVINAKSTKKHRALLESLNKNKFAAGGGVGPAGRYAAGSSDPSVQFTGGKFDYAKTLEEFSGYAEEGSAEMKVFIDSLEVLSRKTGNLTEQQINETNLVKDINDLMIKQKKVSEGTMTAAVASTEAVTALGEAAEKAAEEVKNTWGGFGQTLTGDLKDALSRADFASVGDAIGSGIQALTQRISSKILDRAFAPMEAGIDKWLLSMDTMEVKGEGMFDRLGNVGAQMFGGLGNALGGMFSGGGGGIFSAITGMLGFANGGQVSGPGSGTSDSIMARLSNGEFVVNAQAAQANMGLLTQINGGYNKGGTAGTHKGEKKGTGSSGGLAGLLKFLIPGSGLLDILAKGMDTSGGNGLFSNSTLGGFMPDLPTRPVMERGRGFKALNGGASGGYAATPDDYKRSEERRTSLVDRMLTTKARKDQLQQLTTGQRAAYESGVRQKDSRGLYNNANNVMSRISGGKLGVSNRQRENATLNRIKNRSLSNFTTKDGKAIGGISNSFDRSDTRLKAVAPRTGHPSDTAKARPVNTGHPSAGYAKGGLVGRPKMRIPKFATGGRVNTGGGSSNGDIYLTLNNNYDVQSAMNPQEFQAMLANNSELSFLSVEKKLRETGRSLYK